ncbi:MAG: phage tail sheath family protein [Rhodothermales bacterium]
MPNYLAPGIYVEEVAGGARPIEAVGTSTAGFVGVAPDPQAHLNEYVAITNWSKFLREFVPEGAESTPLSHAVYGFFENGGSYCYVVNVGEGGSIAGGGRERSGLQLFEEVDDIAIVAAPGFTDAASYDALLGHCEKLKDRVAVLDAPCEVSDINLLTQVATVSASSPRRSAADTEEGEGGEASGSPASGSTSGGSSRSTGLGARASKYGAIYFPCITVRNALAPNDENGRPNLVSVAPSGHIAGLWARNDATRGVHKAPANETLRGALDVSYRLTRAEQDILNPAGVNCIRLFPREGIRVWGARTLSSDPEWRYVNVRRLFNMIEESIAESTRWIVFEPNDHTLWKSIRRDVSAFLTRLWRDGALMGRSPQEAFFVKCDEETNPPEVIDAGIVMILVGIAPVKPAEFIVFRISQYEGGVEVETEGGTRA